MSDAASTAGVQTGTGGAVSRGAMASLGLSLRFALRELRGGLRGFYVFLACIALGVAAIAGVNSVASSITDGIAEQGQTILGGDVAATLVQQPLPEAQFAFLEGFGTVSETESLRSMARLPDGSAQTLVEVKAVDGLYPLYGRVETDAPERDANNPANRLGNDCILIEALLGERLGIQPGDTVEIGKQAFVVDAILRAEPDRLSDGFGFGPRVLMSRAGLEASRLVQPGSLVTRSWKVKFDDPSEAAVKRFAEQAETRYGDTGWRLRSRENAAPALSRNISRFSDFLTLVGLTALIVGGVGVANAIRAYLDSKRQVIATFKSLGAPGGLIFTTYLVQIMILALGGILIGLAIGAAMPLVAGWALADVLPLPQDMGIKTLPLLLGALYGLLTAIAFALWPLGAAREIPATDLFRSQTGSFNAWPRPAYLMALAVLVALLSGMAVFMAQSRFVAVVFAGGILFAFVLLRAVAWGIMRVAKAAPQVKSTGLRMAVANIHRPGSLTNSVVLSLGLGLALLVSLALIDANLRQQVSGNLPQRAPDFFFVDIQNTQQEGFEALLREQAPQAKVFSVPMLRGRIVSLKGIAAQDYPTENGGAWVLRGDRGITYAKNLPENSTLSKGEWWPDDYSGPPLVSFTAEEAGELNLDIGDEIVVNVLGRNITARIASIRNVEWETLAINFVMVFSPNTFAGAPHSLLATLTMTDDGLDAQALEKRDGSIVRAVAKDYPAVTTVRVREALDMVNGLIAQLATAIRAAASVALVASVLVLGGALAAGNSARIHDSVVLKTLGATRSMLTRSFVLEYALLGLATAVFALFAGGIAAWFVVTQIMQFPYQFSPAVAVTTVAVALVMTVGFGLIGTWRVLGQKAAPVLREL